MPSRSIQSDQSPTGVTASGWGAGQTGTALGILADNADPNDLKNVDLVILDNNTNRAGGGFWTTYAPFAPLLLTSAEPTPSNLGRAWCWMSPTSTTSTRTPPSTRLIRSPSATAWLRMPTATVQESTAVIPPNVIDEAQNPAAKSLTTRHAPILMKPLQCITTTC